MPLAWVSRAFLALHAKQRLAVGLLVASCFAGMLVSVCDPALALWQRLFRVGFDVLFLIGVTNYLADPLANAPRQQLVTWWVQTTRVLIALVTVIAIIGLFASIGHGDPWLLAYRLTMGGILLVGIVFGTVRPIPTKYLKRVTALAFVAVAIEGAAAIYVVGTVDMPLALAAADQTLDQASAELAKGNAPANPILRRLLEEDRRQNPSMALEMNRTVVDSVRMFNGQVFQQTWADLAAVHFDRAKLLGEVLCGAREHPFGGYQSSLGRFFELSRLDCPGIVVPKEGYGAIIADFEAPSARIASFRCPPFTVQQDLMLIDEADRARPEQQGLRVVAWAKLAARYPQLPKALPTVPLRAVYMAFGPTCRRQNHGLYRTAYAARQSQTARHEAGPPSTRPVR